MIIPGSSRGVRARWLLVGAMFLALSALFGADASLQRWSDAPTPPSFERIGTSQGLSHGQVWSILQDSRQQLWFGTDDGLNRYDGNRFTVFRHEGGKANSLGGNQINRLLEDRKGRLWIGTNDAGLSRLDLETMTFHSYPVSQEPGGEPFSKISALAEDAEGNLWIGSDEGLCLLSRDSMDSARPRFQRMPRGPDPASNIGGDSKYLPGTWVNCLFIDHQGTLWIGFQDIGLCRVKKGPTRGEYHFQHFAADPLRPDTSPPSTLRTINEDAAGVLWMGGDKTGLYRFLPDRGLFHRFLPMRSDAQSLSHAYVIKVIKDRTGLIWVGLDGGGINKMLPREHPDDPPRFQRFMHDSGNPRSLSTNATEALYEDRSGVLWVSCYMAGLNKLAMNPSRGVDRERQSVVNYRALSTNPASLSGNLANAFCEDRYGNLWIGIDQFGLNRVVPGSGQRPLRFEHFRAKGTPGSLPDDTIMELYLDSRRQLWTFGFEVGLIRIDQPSATAAPTFSAGLGGGGFGGILEDRAHRLWVTFGTPTFELGKYDSRQNKVLPFPLKRRGLPGLGFPGYLSMVEDKYGTLWLGGADALDRVNPDTGEIRRYHPGKLTCGLSSIDCNKVHIDRSGNLWVGTNGGGLVQSTLPPFGVEPQFTIYDKAMGLPSNVIMGILEDAEGQLWISTNLALCRFDPKHGKVIPFIWQAELENASFVRHACFQSPKGEMFFGSNQGFYVFHPANIQMNPIIPVVAITDLKLFNRSVQVGESFNGRKILARSITETQEITLTYSDAIFSLDFAVLHFVSPGRNQYAYVMEGLEQAWNQAGNQHSITYTTLPPGDYTFRVMGANCDGVWSQASTNLKIRVLQPWWHRWWFRLGTTIALAALAIVVIWMRLGALGRQNRLLENAVADRTKALARANEALLEQSLTDPLTGLRNRRFLGACMPEDVAKIQRMQRDAASNNLARMKVNIDMLFVMVDLDHFKLVNDQYGHQAGDMVLQQMGRILKTAARDSDTLVRWGGEEFLIVAKHTARADAPILPERIRAAVEAHLFDIGEANPIHCTCSVGFAIFPLLPNDVESYRWEQIVELADHCLYAAKHGGRNAWVGLVLDAAFSPEQPLPRDIPQLIKSQSLPLISSFQAPIRWEFKSGSL